MLGIRLANRLFRCARGRVEAVSINTRSLQPVDLVGAI